MFYAVEFVADKMSKKPLPPSLRFASRVQQAAFDRGVAVYPGPVNPEGADSDHILIAPPYNISKDDLEKAVKVLKDAYDEVEMEIRNVMIVIGIEKRQ